MNDPKMFRVSRMLCATLAALAVAPAAWTQTPRPAPERALSGARVPGPESQAGSASARLACTSLTSAPTATVPLGKSRVLSLGAPAVRLIGAGRPSSWVGQPVEVEEQSPSARNRSNLERPPTGTFDGVADTEITLLSPTEVLVVGRRAGSANMIVQDRQGHCVVRDIIVAIDSDTLQAKLGELMPAERGIKVSGADNAVVLTGTVSDPSVLDQVLSVATAYGDGKKVVNLLRVDSPSQVMLEVKIAEVSKSLLDRFGLDYNRVVTSADGATTNVISGIVGGAAGTFGRFNPNLSGGNIAASGGAAIGSGTGGAGAALGTTLTRGATLVGVDLQKQDGVIRVLAEPNIMAVSGQQASFLSGGKIFIPVAQASTGGGSTITLEEKEFGVGLKFMPTVLGGSRINLKLISEASELSQTGSPFTTLNGVTSVLPSLATRRVDTTVQLGDGQSFVVAGLVKNNQTNSIRRIPGLGEIPVLGALFRSTEFQADQTELMFVVTPRLVKPLGSPVVLPTDNHIPPSRNGAVFGGAGEGPGQPAREPSPATAPAPGTAGDSASKEQR